MEAEHPSEVVEILVGAFTGAVAKELAAVFSEWIRDRRDGGERTLKAVTMRRADGTELV